ncbi:MAG TPA: EAL domain-containing protein [Burkholderiales bacterium]
MGLLTDKDALARIQAATDYPLQRENDGWIVGHFFNCRLSSVYQPVFDVSERQVIGHGAYVRSAPIGSDGAGEGALSPWGIFALAAEDPLLVRLDRLCRTLHALNYFSRVPPHQDLHVSVQSRLLESVKDGHGRAFEKVLDLIGVETSRVVIEIPLEVNQDRRLLKHVIVNYRSRGYRIACNHSGATEEWMAELGSLYPDVVRLELKALKRSGSKSLIEAIHRFGASLLVKGVETSEDVSAAVRAGADLLQGRYLGEPTRSIESVSKRAAADLQHPGYAW